MSGTRDGRAPPPVARAAGGAAAPPRHLPFWLGAAALGVALVVGLRLLGNEYG